MTLERGREKEKEREGEREGEEREREYQCKRGALIDTLLQVPKLGFVPATYVCFLTRNHTLFRVQDDASPN